MAINKQNIQKTKRNAEKDVNKTLRHHCKTLSDKQIKQQAGEIIEFLKLVHPHTTQNLYSDAIEIRAIKRDADEFEYVKGYSTFTFAKEKDEEELIKFLTKINGKGFCIYYSLFAFDYNLDVLKDNGKLHNKGIINKTNSTYATTLMADFDNISIDDYYDKYKVLFNQAGIETYDIFTGSGVQSLIFLNKRCYDKTILNKFTKLLIQKGFDVDAAIIDSARVARLPHTYNCKELDEREAKYNPIDAEIPMAVPIESTQKRYSISDIFKSLNGLDDVIKPVTQDEVSDITIEAIQKVDAEETKPLLQSEILEGKAKVRKEIEINIKNAGEAYKDVIDIDTLPVCVQKVLAKPTRTGLRNNVLLFIVPFFKNELGFNVYEAQAVMRIWGSRCEEALSEEFINSEVNRLWVYDVKHKQGYYTQELVDEYGYFDMTIVKDRSYLAIPIRLIDSLSQKSMNPGTLKFYLMFLIHFHKQRKDGVNYNVSMKDVTEICNVSKATASRHLNSLIACGLIIDRKGTKNRKKGDSVVYYPAPIARARGGRKIPVSVIKNIYSKDNNLNDGEAMMMFYLKVVLCYEDVVMTSQSKIAKALCKTQQNINQLTDSLHDKGLIHKETIGNGFWKKTTYEVLE